jgi:signal transduction histidine kinase
MADGAEHSRTAGLKAWAHDARARSTACAAQAGRAAESAAVSRDRVERMIERLAERNPQRAERLYAIGSTATRQRAAIAACKDRFYAGGRAGGQLLPGRQDEPEAAAFSTLDTYLRETAVVQERERIAGELLDNVIQRVFAAGLTLEDAAGLTTKPEAREQIEEVVGDLDNVIRAIRNTVFNLPYPMS